MKTLQLGDELFLRFFLFIRAFFACFPFIKRSIVFFELFFDTPTRWHASISFLVIHQYLFHLKYLRPFPLTFDRERCLEFQ